MPLISALVGAWRLGLGFLRLWIEVRVRIGNELIAATQATEIIALTFMAVTSNAATKNPVRIDFHAAHNVFD